MEPGFEPAKNSAYVEAGNALNQPLCCCLMLLTISNAPPPALTAQLSDNAAISLRISRTRCVQKGKWAASHIDAHVRGVFPLYPEYKRRRSAPKKESNRYKPKVNTPTASDQQTAKHVQRPAATVTRRRSDRRSCTSTNCVVPNPPRPTPNGLRLAQEEQTCSATQAV